MMSESKWVVILMTKIFLTWMRLRVLSQEWYPPSVEPSEQPSETGNCETEVENFSSIHPPDESKSNRDGHGRPYTCKQHSPRNRNLNVRTKGPIESQESKIRQKSKCRDNIQQKITNEDLEIRHDTAIDLIHRYSSLRPSRSD